MLRCPAPCASPRARSARLVMREAVCVSCSAAAFTAVRCSAQTCSAAQSALLCGRPALCAGGKCLFILLLRCCEVSLFRNQAVIPFLQAFQQEFMLFYRSSKSGSLLLRACRRSVSMACACPASDSSSCPAACSVCASVFRSCSSARTLLLGGVQAFRPRQCAGAAGDRAACHGTACLQDLSV